MACPPSSGEAVVLCDFEGMKYEEIASIVGVPVGTVRSRVFRGRRSMQTEMRPYLRKRDNLGGRVEN